MVKGSEALAPSSFFEFDTQSVPLPLRQARWSELGSDTLSDLVVTPSDQRSFHARMQRVEIGDMGMVFIDSTPALATSTSGKTGAWAAPDRDAFVMTIADRGQSRISQSNWSVVLAEGDIVFRDLTRPWSSQSTENMGLILVKIPYSCAARKIDNPEALIGRHLAGGKAAVGLAVSVVRACRGALLSEPDGDWHLAAADLLGDMVSLVGNVDQGSQVRTSEALCSTAKRSVRRDAITFVMRNLRSPDLSVHAVADQIGVSMRQLQRAFLLDGTSPRQFIANARLDEAAKKLVLSSERGPARIIDIALDVGFNDVSHFSRSFRYRFGCSPSQFRSQQSGRGRG